MLVCVALSDGCQLAALSSRAHVVWALAAGGWLGVGNDPRYSKSKVFDPFPFPDPDEALKAELRAAGEELDAFRKARQAEHPRLTLTQMYNVRERIRAIERAVPSPLAGDGQGGGKDAGGGIRGLPPSPALPREGGEGGAARSPATEEVVPPLSPAEEKIKEEGLILILNELHDRIDRLTRRAYGWPEDISDAEILARLVALNKERAAEERRGKIRWLRPDYQMARAGVVSAKEEQAEADLVAPAAKAAIPAFPKGAVDQSAAVAAALAEAGGPVSAAEIAGRFKRAKQIEPKVAEILAAYVRTGFAASADGGRTFQTRRTA